MKKHFSLLICGFLLVASLLFMACPLDPEENTDPTYLVKLEANPPEGGELKASPESGPTGTEVTVEIKSGNDYYLEEVFVDEEFKGRDNPVTVILMDQDVVVKAVFKNLPPNNYKVILNQPEGGTITISISGADGKEYGSAGSTVTLSNQAAEGYVFKGYTATDADGEAVVIAEDGTFTLPAKHVTVSGVFDKLADKSIDELSAAGKEALKSGDLTTAISAYETVYSKDPDNTEALVYSTLGKLASIAWSKEVGDFFKNRLGLKYYPNTLDALLNPQSWFDYYPNKDWDYYYYDSGLGETLIWQSKDKWADEEYFEKYYTKGDGYYYQGPYKFVSADLQYYDENETFPKYSYEDEAGNYISWRERENWGSGSSFDKYHPEGTGYYYSDAIYIFVDSVPRYNYSSQPPLNVPEWVKEKTPYTDSLVAIDGEDVASTTTWSIVLIANLIDKNTTGLNGALDDAINAIFNNPNYKEAETRAAKLKSAATSIELDGDIVQLLGLSQFLGDGEGVYVGWAELELLLSALKLVKATLLYVDSYNWEYDIGFVKDLPWDESALDPLDAIAGNRNKVLPLRTGFMTARGGSYLEDSRKAYVEALTSIIGVYDYYTGDDSPLPTGIKTELEKFASYEEEVVKAKDAIDKKGTFTVPANLLNGQELTVNFEKFFTPGQLALENLIETEGSGDTKSPVFYGFNGNLSNPGKITTLDDFGKEEYQSFGFNVKTDAIGEIIEGEFADNLLESVEFLPVLNEMTARIAWAVYHWEDGGKEFIEENFAGDE